MEQLGFALVALVAIAVGVVRLGRHDLSVVRTISPERAPAGQPLTLSLEVENRGRGPAPLVLLEDRLPPGLRGRARFSIPGIEAGGKRAISLTLNAVTRGRYQIGPLALSFVDPFGLARLGGGTPEVAGFVAYPRIEPLGLPRDPGDRRSVATAALRQPTVARGEDFFTLREYTEGDDLRKVHWPSTAKRGRYMIRQEETPWHTRATIVLDDRIGAHDGTGASHSFERAVEAAASLVDLYHRSAYGYRLGAAHHPGVPVGRGQEHLARCLDLLALIEASERDDEALAARLGELQDGSPEAALVVVAGTIGAREALVLSRLTRRFRMVTAVMFPAHRFGGLDTKSRWEGERSVVEVARLLERSGARAMVLGPDEALSSAWTTGRNPQRDGSRAWARKPELA